MEYIILITVGVILCFGILILPRTETLGLFFLLSSFSVTKWASHIHEIIPFSFIWIFLVMYIILSGIRFRINLVNILISSPKQFKLYFILILFGIFSLAGTFYSLEPSMTIKRSFGYILNAIFFFSFMPMICSKTGSLNIDRLLLYINFSFLMPILIGLFMLINNPGEVTYLHGKFVRFTGLFGNSIEGLSGNPNVVGYNSFILSGIAATGLLSNKKKFWKLLYFFSAIAGISALVASASRTGALALMVLLAIIFFMKGKTSVKYLSIGSIILLLLAFLGFLDPLKEAIDFESVPVIGRLMEFDTSGRVELWIEGLSTLNDVQFLTGIGLGSTSFQFWPFLAGRMHNIYFELLIETGIIGIASFLSFLISGAVLIIKSQKKSESSKKNLWTGIAAFYFALCSYGLSESLLTPANPSFHLLLLCIFLTFPPLNGEDVS